MSTKKPIIKEFNNSKYKEALATLKKDKSRVEFERLSEVLAPYILEDYEGFKNIEKVPDFRGTPFDFLGFKNGIPYLIVFNGSLNNFNTPNDTQKVHLQEILDQVENLNKVFLQVKINKSQYCLLYDDETNIPVQMSEIPFGPVIEWIRERF